MNEHIEENIKGYFLLVCVHPSLIKSAYGGHINISDKTGDYTNE